MFPALWAVKQQKHSLFHFKGLILAAAQPGVTCVLSLTRSSFLQKLLSLSSCCTPFVAPTGTNTPEHLGLTYLNYYFCFLIHQNLTDLAVSWQENGEVTCWCPVTPNLKSSDSFLFLNTVTHPDSCSLVEFGTGSPRKGCETAFFLSVFLSVVFLNKLGDVISLSSNSFRQTLLTFSSKCCWSRGF